MTIAIYAAVGAVIRELRRERRTSRATLAAASTIPLSRLRDIEFGWRDPRLDEVEALADTLQVPTTELLARAEALRRRDAAAREGSVGS